MAPFVPLLKQWRKAVVIEYCLNESWKVPVVTGTPGAGAGRWTDDSRLQVQEAGAGVRTLGVPGTNWHNSGEGERLRHTHTQPEPEPGPRSRGGVGADSGGERLWARAEVIKRTLYGAITDIMTWDTLPALPPPNWEHRQQIKIESNVTRNSHYIVLGPAKQKPRCAESGQKQSTCERLASVLQQH